MAPSLVAATPFEAVVEDSYTTFDRVREWKRASGGSAVGYFPVYFPEELAHALGFLSVRLFGASGRVRLDQATSHTQSFVCSIARSVFQLASEGALDVFNLLLFSNICDVARNLSGITKRNFPAKEIEYLHYPINNDSPRAAAYLAEEYRRLAARLGELGGKALQADALRQSIALHNEKRRLIRELTSVKQNRPWVLPYAEFYSALRAGGAMPTEDYIAALRDYLRALEGRREKPMDKLRVVVFGNFCEQAPLALMRIIEEAGCYIVRDEALMGLWWMGHVVDDGGDPLRSLADAYVDNGETMTVRFHPRIDKQSYIVELLRGVRAEGAIFCTPKFCEPALYDYIIYKSALDKAGIPYMHAEYEESGSSFESVRTMVETFAESLLFE